MSTPRGNDDKNVRTALSSTTSPPSPPDSGRSSLALDSKIAELKIKLDAADAVFASDLARFETPSASPYPPQSSSPPGSDAIAAKTDIAAKGGDHVPTEGASECDGDATIRADASSSTALNISVTPSINVSAPPENDPAVHISIKRKLTMVEPWLNGIIPPGAESLEQIQAATKAMRLRPLPIHMLSHAAVGRIIAMSTAYSEMLFGPRVRPGKLGAVKRAVESKSMKAKMFGKWSVAEEMRRASRKDLEETDLTAMMNRLGFGRDDIGDDDAAARRVRERDANVERQVQEMMELRGASVIAG
ncbi:hypothetical protein MMC25_006865 [Agyrium rufum]|nr:hypothetical protein [Agyrium rufum]